MNDDHLLSAQLSDRFVFILYGAALRRTRRERGCRAMMVLMIEVLLISGAVGLMYAAIGPDRE